MRRHGIALLAAGFAVSGLLVALTLAHVHLPVRAQPSTVTPTLPPGSVLIVTKLADTDDGVCNADCSLREAMANAPQDAVINFAPGVTGTLVLKIDSLEPRTSMTINGPGPKSSALIIDGNNEFTIFQVGFYVEDITLSLNTLTITEGSGLGGGIRLLRGTLQVNYVTFDSNRGSIGGGIRNEGGRVTIQNSTFTNNRATGGGGVYSRGLLSVSNSTFIDNSAGVGGSIYSGPSANISNSTFLVRNWRAGETIRASGLTLRNSIIAYTSSIGLNCDGEGITAEGSNLQWPAPPKDTPRYNCGGVQVGDPKLDVLADNGGPTMTLRLLPGSAAIGAGQNCSATDQRGAVLPPGAPCDIGAYQSAGVLPPGAQPIPSPTPKPTAAAMHSRQ